MIRFVCRQTDIGAAANIGGPVNSKWETFTDCHFLERWLRFDDVSADEKKWLTRECIGVEIPND